MFQFWKYLFSSKKSDIATQNESNSVQDDAAVKNPVQEEEVKEESPVEEPVKEEPVEETVTEEPVQDNDVLVEAMPSDSIVTKSDGHIEYHHSYNKDNIMNEVKEDTPVQEAIEDVGQMSLVQEVVEEDNKPLDTIKEVECESTDTEKKDERGMSCDSDAMTIPTTNNTASEPITNPNQNIFWP